MENSVYVAVFSDQEFHYDDCGYSHLPEFHAVFGVFAGKRTEQTNAGTCVYSRLHQSPGAACEGSYFSFTKGDNFHGSVFQGT